MQKKKKKCQQFQRKEKILLCPCNITSCIHITAFPALRLYFAHTEMGWLIPVPVKQSPWIREPLFSTHVLAKPLVKCKGVEGASSTFLGVRMAAVIAGKKTPTKPSETLNKDQTGQAGEGSDKDVSAATIHLEHTGCRLAIVGRRSGEKSICQFPAFCNLMKAQQRTSSKMKGKKKKPL